MRNLKQTERDAPEKYQKGKNKINKERKPNTIFNEIRQFAYVLGARETEIFLIQQPITSSSRVFWDTFRDTIHEGSTLLFITRES